MELRIATCCGLPRPDEDQDVLVDALAGRGVRARPAAWDDPDEDWDAAVPTVIRSTWNYVRRPAAFRDWIARAARAAPLWNPAHVVLANLHKGYLLDLAARGVAVVPTELLPRGADADAAALCARRGWAGIVVKPAVGAGSFETRRFAPGDTHAADAFLRASVRERDTLVQPYLESVEDHGERALVWLDGAISHAVRKTPRFSGDRHDVSAAVPVAPDEGALAEQVLSTVAGDLLYARVDVARATDGTPCLMELELTEPSLYLREGANAPDRLAAALHRRLAAGAA